MLDKLIDNYIAGCDYKKQSINALLVYIINNPEYGTSKELSRDPWSKPFEFMEYVENAYGKILNYLLASNSIEIISENGCWTSFKKRRMNPVLSIPSMTLSQSIIDYVHGPTSIEKVISRMLDYSFSERSTRKTVQSLVENGTLKWNKDMLLVRTKCRKKN